MSDLNSAKTFFKATAAEVYMHGHARQAEVAEVMPTSGGSGTVFGRPGVHCRCDHGRTSPQCTHTQS